MRKEAIALKLKELLQFSLVYVICTILFLIVFNKSILIAFKVITGIFYLYMLPGFVILLLFTNLNFLEKLILGGILGNTLVAIIAYYLNVIIYVPFRLTMSLPLIIVIISYTVFYLKSHKG